MSEFAHPVYQHPNGDKCIWIEQGYWFVPLDVGGEGYACEKWHPGDDERKKLARVAKLSEEMKKYSDDYPLDEIDAQHYRTLYACHKRLQEVLDDGQT